MKSKFTPWYFTPYCIGSPREDIVKPLEVTQYAIVISGLKPFQYRSYFKFSRLEFKCKHSKKVVKIIDSIITSEMVILYIDKDARKYPYNKCILISELDYSSLIPNMYDFVKMNSNDKRINFKRI